MKVSVSLMCMDLLRLKEQIEVLNKRADFYHIDIMDGHYVKNITLSPMFIRALSPISELPIDVHLMVENPMDFIDEIAESGADYICPHAETINKDAFRVINHIKSLGKKVGVVLNPATNFDYIKHYVDLLDKITIMTVDPGFAGQKFIYNMLDKIEEVKKYKKDNNLNYLIEIDGSCNKKTFEVLLERGAEVLIVGSSGLFSNSTDLNEAYDIMLSNVPKKFK